MVLNSQERDSLQEVSKLYQDSIEMLSNAFPTTDGQPARLGAVIGWPVFTDRRFLDLLRHNDPLALIVLAYYGRALHAFSGIWWIHGLGQRLVQAVSQILGADYRPLLNWPLQGVAVGA